MSAAHSSSRMVIAIAGICAYMVFGISCVHEVTPDSDSQPRVLLDVNYRSGASEPMRQSLLSTLNDREFEVEERVAPFDESMLLDTDILIIATAVAPENQIAIDPVSATPSEQTEALLNAWRLPTPSAFSQREIEIIRLWVESGGALLIMIDHMPFPGGVSDLAAAFGMRVSNGYVTDSTQMGADYSGASVAANLLFSRQERTLASHAITDGLSGGQRVNLVASFVGSAVRLPDGAVSLLTLGPEHVSFLPDVAFLSDSALPSDSMPRESVEGWSQFGVMRYGRGRVALMAEFGLASRDEDIPGFVQMLEAQGVSFPDPADIQNSQLFNNTLDWLSADE